MAQNTKISKIALPIFLFLIGGYMLSRNAKTLFSLDYLRGDDYVKVRLDGRVDSIYQYNKGYPVVSIKGQKFQMQLESDAQRYLAKGDSVVKEPGSLSITTYRFYPNYIEIMRWEYIPDSHPSLVSKKIQEK